ncbi:putative sigma-54 modulation protein [Bacilli bacterium PM5-3]|nr:putative sigma-54 modulation protein [Bacilli bacterium PM5-3]MDH6603438.1 putative sigma-54 modulation protein [Bacilli bacterium PM5-9]
MKYSIKGKNVQVTEAIENYIESRLDLLDKYFVVDDSTVAKVLIRVYDSEQKIETTIPTKFGMLRAEARDKDLYTAIDSVVEKLEAQIRKQKTKLKDRRAKEKLGYAFNMEFLKELADDEFEEDLAEVVRTKELTPEAKDIDTAILEMEMLHHSFYIFRDIETENISVLYKRKDGGYGLIETN